MNEEGTARLYLAKIQSSASRGIDFDLSFADFKRLHNTKTCRYTGVRLTKAIAGRTTPTDRTIDRIDPSMGYVAGNVVACCHAANQIKCHWESDKSILSDNDVERMVKTLKELKA